VSKVIEIQARLHIKVPDSFDHRLVTTYSGVTEIAALESSETLYEGMAGALCYEGGEELAVAMEDVELYIQSYAPVAVHQP